MKIYKIKNINIIRKNTVYVKNKQYCLNVHIPCQKCFYGIFCDLDFMYQRIK